MENTCRFMKRVTKQFRILLMTNWRITHRQPLGFPSYGKYNYIVSVIFSNRNLVNKREKTRNVKVENRKVNKTKTFRVRRNMYMILISLASKKLFLFPSNLVRRCFFLLCQYESRLLPVFTLFQVCNCFSTYSNSMYRNHAKSITCRRLCSNSRSTFFPFLYLILLSIFQTPHVLFFACAPFKVWLSKCRLHLAYFCSIPPFLPKF